MKRFYLISLVALANLTTLTMSSAYAAYSSLGVANSNAYTLVFSGQTNSGASCTNGTCYPQLATNGEQWINLNSASSWMDLEYDVCQSISYTDDGKIICDGYLGHVGISFDANKTTISNASGGNATLSAYQAGQAFKLTFTPTSVPVVNFPTPQTYNQIPYRGVSLSGGEWDYKFQLPSVNDAAYFDNKGMNTIRLPFKWEYLQPNLNTAIDFSNGNAQQYSDLVNSLTAKGFNVIVDMHDYMLYNGNIIGLSSKVTAQQYATAWGQIASQFKNNSKVLLDLMNEPTQPGLTNTVILSNYNAAITAIRNVGFTGLILLEGNNWSSLASWTQTPVYGGDSNADTFVPGKIQDPLKNYAITPHLYYNSNTGGGDGNSECVNPSNMLKIENFSDFMSWVKENKVSVFLDETGTIATTQCAQDIDNMITAIEQNPYSPGNGGFIGWAGWVGGSSNAENPLYIGQVNGQDVVQMTNGYGKHLTPPE